jgi:hypothetical protein
VWGERDENGGNAAVHGEQNRFYANRDVLEDGHLHAYKIHNVCLCARLCVCVCVCVSVCVSACVSV